MWTERGLLADLGSGGEGRSEHGGTDAVSVLFGFTHRSGLARPWGSCVSGPSRPLCPAAWRGRTCWRSHRRRAGPSPILPFPVCASSRSDRCEAASGCGFELRFPTMSDVGHLDVVFGEMSSRSLPSMVWGFCCQVSGESARPETQPSSDKWLTNTPPHSVGCVSNVLTALSAEQELPSLVRSHLPVFMLGAPRRARTCLRGCDLWGRLQTRSKEVRAPCPPPNEQATCGVSDPDSAAGDTFGPTDGICPDRVPAGGRGTCGVRGSQAPAALHPPPKPERSPGGPLPTFYYQVQGVWCALHSSVWAPAT